MHLSPRPTLVAILLKWLLNFPCVRSAISVLLLAGWLTTSVTCMTDDEAHKLRDETVDLFYHGFDSYMKYAFPEDELKPLSCVPLTRDRENEGHFELNDVLGNYTLTLVDSLSTLAIFASSQSTLTNKRKPLRDFQDGVASLVRLYGDGSSGPSGQGVRAHGFDLDSKVQVFETVIRGVGGLLSAHLFAIGELPITNYNPTVDQKPAKSQSYVAVKWPNGFTYDGQLLRLASDLGNRLLPAFYTPTGLPYPRVNLRHGVPFYPNSPLNADAEHGQCSAEATGQREITETCSAGAGSLVLEFGILSRLTNDMRFEEFAQRAFDAVWTRRTAVGLVGAGIDAETGEWVSPFTGVGAGVDSFFEYAMKSHILFSGLPVEKGTNSTALSDYFLSVWQNAHENNRRHLLRGAAFQHPHYVQGDLYTGAVRAFWIDSLSAYYPGLLALSGSVDEAIDVHLLFAALWSRYSSLPERWNAAGGAIDSGLRWWGGRPEFIESTWYLFRATEDAWFLHVGEMVLDDVKKRCWTECGWAGLEDVRTGELKDRMESFFLGETAKYLFLLFEKSHPLNTIEAPWVMNTEGHPLLLPRTARYQPATIASPDPAPPTMEVCQPVPSVGFLGASNVVSRPNFFHAASLARLHFVPALGAPTNTSIESSHWDAKYNLSSPVSRNQHHFYPWTLPSGSTPINGTSARMETRSTFDLSFPIFSNAVSGVLTVKRIPEGISVNSISGLKLGMIREPQPLEEVDGRISVNPVFRIHAVSHLSLGRDEKVLMGSDAIAALNPVDPYFTRHRDITSLDVVIDVHGTTEALSSEPSSHLLSKFQADNGVISLPNGTVLTNVLAQLNSAFQQQLSIDDVVTSANVMNKAASTSTRPILPATMATGPGAGTIPDVADAPGSGTDPLTWMSVYVTDESCSGRLDVSIPRTHQVIVMKRGGCSFNQKLRSIPSFAPSNTSLQLVVMVSPLDDGTNGGLIRPLLDDVQTTPSGVVRPHPIPMLMVEGDEETMDTFRRARSIGVRRRYHFSSQGLKISNLFIV